VRELKALLDEKDENIDVLSRIHSHSSQQGQSRRKSFSASPPGQEPQEQERDDVFRVVQSPMLLNTENSDAYFMGTSSGRGLVGECSIIAHLEPITLTFKDSFKNKLQATACSGIDINNTAFFSQDKKSSRSLVSWQPPARLVSDQLINIFFQEWAPLFPILHKPTFLAVYEEYVSCPEVMEDKKSLAQLHLVFSIAAHSSGVSRPSVG
jgi:hypothetical protein